MTKVKICGITNLEDARAARDAGADFLGFILYPASVRYLTDEGLKAITGPLRQEPNCPQLVGVFVDQTAEAVAQVMDDCGLDLAQLSGEEPPAFVGEEGSPLYGRCYKALHPTSLVEAEADAEWFTVPDPAPGQPTLQLDSYHPTMRGGTGQTIDWNIAAKLAENSSGLMLAGGLNPGNVGEAIRKVRPFAVDVASGVEVEPGRKDHQKIRDFIDNSRRAN